MAAKAWLADIDRDNRLRYELRTDHGDVVAFVVQLETWLDGEYRPVVRYDSAHGHGHRDILDARGKTTLKEWLPDHLSLKECLDWADQDLRDRWEDYRDRFLENWP